MEAFAQFTQAAKMDGDLATYERCLQFADRHYAGADAALSGAFRMSYLEHLEFEGSRGPAAWQLVPSRLQNVWNQIAAENRRLQSLPQKHGGSGRTSATSRRGRRAVRVVASRRTGSVGVAGSATRAGVGADRIWAGASSAGPTPGSSWADARSTGAAADST